MIFASITRFSCAATLPVIDCEQLAKLPDSNGVAGAYAGFADGALIVAGGTNFPDAPPWQNGTKTWHDTAYVLPSPDGQWLQGFTLPRPMAYGVSLTTKSGVLCIGGCTDKVNLADVFELQWDGNELTQRAMPSLPRPTSCAAGAMIGSRVYVAGGQAGPDPTSGPSLSDFWMLDLSDDVPRWIELPTWPGPKRFYAIAGSDGESFYLISGIRRVVDDAGKPTLEYLKDAYRFDPSTGTWHRLADLPHPNAAVASPAPYVDGGLLLLGQGADGRGTDLPLEKRGGFGREALRFDVKTGRWKAVASLPFGLAAVTSAQWNGSIIIASGESRPGVRSQAVWAIKRSAFQSPPR